MYRHHHNIRSFALIMAMLSLLAVFGLLLMRSPRVAEAAELALSQRGSEGSRALSINWSAKPQDRQLYPRNRTNNQATVELAGTVTTAGLDRVRIKVLRDDAAFDQADATLTYSGGEAYFALSFDISAEKSNYDFQIYSVIGGSETLEETIEDVIAGDVIIIQGQSNAVAGAYDADGNGVTEGSELSDPSQNNYFVRSFGTATLDPWQVGSNLEWYAAIGDGFNGVATIGQWGLRLGNQLVEDEGIPLAIINGAQGGSAIKIFQRRESGPLDPISNYGRLLYRMQEAGLQDSPRAIIWYQGESDIADADKHEEGFDRLYNAWAEDYPSVEQVYVIQVRDGCFGNNADTRSRQRDLVDRYDNIQVIASNGIEGHRLDCHYNWQDGYEMLGDWLYNPLARDLFGASVGNDVNSPNIERAYFSNAGRTQITLPLRNAGDSMTWESDGGGSAASGFSIVGDSGAVVQSGTVSGDSLVLSLNRAPIGEVGLSYTGQYAYVGQSNSVYWVRNSNDMGLVSFYDQPILADAAQPRARFEMAQDGTQVSFDAALSADYDGTITNYAWDFGDGTTSSGASATASHSFAVNSSFDVTLTVTDNNGNQHVTSVQVVTPADVEAACSTQGINFERFDNISGYTIADLTGHANYPDSPDLSSALTKFETVENFGENYGARMRGYIVAPYSGTYQFWIASDDHAIVSLSTDESPANASELVSNSSYTYVRLWESSSEPWASSQRSAEISLVAGQRYYVEALYKEGSGGDHFSMAWRTPMSFDYEMIELEYLCLFDDSLDAAPIAAIETNLVSGPAPLSVTFDAGNSADLDGFLVSYEWDFGDFQSGSGDLLTHVFGTPGSYDVVLTITDNDGRESTASQQIVVETPSCNGGGLLYERWDALSGETIADLTAYSAYPNSPDVAQIIDNFEFPAVGTDNYGARARGYIVPPTSGVYQFRIASDDASEVWLTTSGGVQQIVSVAGWVPQRQWMEEYVWNASQESAEITLTAGQPYFIEALFKEAWGSDHLSLAWKQPGVEQFALINCSNLQPFSTSLPTAVGLTAAPTSNGHSAAGVFTLIVLMSLVTVWRVMPSKRAVA